MQSTHLSWRRPLQMAGWQFLACFAVFIYRVVQVYGVLWWNDTRAVNWVVAWLPSVIAIVVAIFPDQGWNPGMRLRWRFLIVLCGIGYSLALWHQQTLNDQAAQKLINAAI